MFQALPLRLATMPESSPSSSSSSSSAATSKPTPAPPSPLSPLSSRQRRDRAVLLGLSVCLLLAAWGSVLRVREGMAQAQEQTRRSGLQLAEALDHELDIHVYNLLAMKYLAERFFSGRIRGAENPVIRLHARDGGQAYESRLPPQFGDPASLGRVTGFGPLPALDDPVAEELTMAVGLTPLMRAIRERSPDVPWVQYTSARHFMFVFPAKGAETFQFRPELLGREYFAHARPEANPERRPFWSQPYLDAGDREAIVTVTQPIDQNGQFRGSVSIDVRVSSLQRGLAATPLPHAHVHLVDARGRSIVAVAPAPGQEDDSELRPHIRLRLPLKSAPWALELHLSEDDLLRSSLHSSAGHLATVLVLALSLGFVFTLTRKNRQIEALAQHDGLTGLYNRRHFDTLAPQQWALAQRQGWALGLALIDIDHFKKYNDHYGHAEGDQALRAVAQALQAALRRSSDLLFRVGGEEFAVLLMLTEGQALEPVLAQLNAAVRDLHRPHQASPSGQLSISIGATVLGRPTWLDLGAAYRRADEALYEAKAGGRDQVVLRMPPEPPADVG